MSLLVGRHITDEIYFIEVSGQRELMTQDGLTRLIDALISLYPPDADPEEELPGEAPILN